MEIFNLPSKFENVEFDCIAEDTLYRFRLHVFRDMMYASIYADNEPIILGQRCVQNLWLIPRGLVPDKGNFRFEVNGEDYPWWEDFNNGTKLVYYTRDEIAEMG